MIKYLLYAVFFILFACNSSTEKTDAKKTKPATTTKAPVTAAVNSYTNDTFYAALPNLLTDLSTETDIENLLSQSWVNADDIEALRFDTDGAIEFPVRSFYMFSDKTMAKNVRNYMEVGSWQFDNEAKTITFYYDGTKDVYKLKALAPDELQLTNIGINSESVQVLVSDGKRHKEFYTDPFYRTNLTWRIRPSTPETDEQIKTRVRKYLQFFILYYKDAIARRAEVVSFYGFPSCIKWYAGGIYIQTDKDVLKNWHALFYNQTQGERGLQLLRNLLSKKYTWPKGDQNWIKKNLFVLEEMYKNL
jgi:hypothetical protein